MTVNTLNISFPDFKMNDIIDPEQFDINNSELVTKINEIKDVINKLTDSITDGASGADNVSLTAIAPFVSTKLQAYLEEVISKLKNVTAGQSGAEFVASAPITGVTGATVYAQLASLKSLLDAITANNWVTTLRIADNAVTTTKIPDEGITGAKLGANAVTNVKIAPATITGDKLVAGTLDNRYYTETETDALLANKANTADVYTKTLTYSKTETDQKVTGIDTKIVVEVFTITNSNNGDGTFTYTDKNGGTHTQALTAEGYQTFKLLEGTYSTGMNRMEAIINDTLHRSTVSGGLREDAPDTVTLVVPEGSGAEVTFKYFASVFVNGMASNAYVGTVQPTASTFPVGFLWINPN